MYEIMREAAVMHKNLILPPYDEIMGMDGFNAICAFSRTFSGGNVYIPGLKTIFKECMEEEIRRFYNGRNIGMLAKKYDFSERHIRNLVKGLRKT